MKSNNEKNVNKGLSLLVKSSIIVFIGVAISKILNYAFRAIIARYYGPEVYGLFSLAVIILSFFTYASFLGFSEGLVRYISFYRGKNEINKIKYIFQITQKILIVSSIIFGIFLFLSAKFISLNIFHNSGLIMFLQLFSISIPLLIISGVYILTLRAFEKISWYSFMNNIFQNALRLIILIFFIFLGIKSNSIQLSFLLTAFATLIFSYIVCKYKIPVLFEKYLLSKKTKRKTLKDILSYSWPIMFLGAISTLFYWIDSFTIGYYKSAFEVGVYNAAVPIVALLSIVPDIFMQLFFPLITKEYSRKNIFIIKELSKQIGKWIFALSLPIFIIMVLFPGAIINILFGASYLSAQNSLRILAIGGIFSIFFVLLTNLLSMAGKTKTILINIILMSIFNLFLNILLVQKFGSVGAAISTMIAGIVFNVVLIIQVRHYLLIIPFRRKMIKIAVVSLIPIALLLIIKQFVPINLFTLILLGIFFFVSYFLTIFVTGCFDKNDLFVFNAIKNKIIPKKEAFITSRQE